MLSTYRFSLDTALPQVFNKAKDKKITCTDMKKSWNSVLHSLAYSKCPIESNSGPQLQTSVPRH